MELGVRTGKTTDATIVMKPQPHPPTPEVLAGLVERVTYHNEENGFCVLRIRARGHREPVTVIGNAAMISAGEWVTASGEWINDRTHGQQYKAKFLKTSEPTSLDGIEKYLGSGIIRGIGPVYAKKLVRAFGEKVFDMIEAEPERLREVTGIGPARADRITAAWAEQKIVREIMVFLHSHGVGTARAVRIYKTYGADAVQVMSENPYRLARNIRGIGFKTADAIATKLGIEKTATIRVRAGISYALTEALNEGHCGLPTDELVPLAGVVLHHDRDDHGRIFRALAFVDGRGVGRHQRVEFAKPVGDGAAVEASGELAVVGINIVDVADVAVIDLLVVVVLDLHYLVAGRKAPTEPLDLALSGGVQRRLQFNVERACADE
jgi:DNA-binding Lrp family transcriptional regulator